jgi:hypothetical protein
MRSVPRPWGERLTGVLDAEHHILGIDAGRDPHRTPFWKIVNDRVLQDGHQLQQ